MIVLQMEKISSVIFNEDEKLSSRGLNETLSSSVSDVHWMGLQTNL